MTMPNGMPPGGTMMQPPAMPARAMALPTTSPLKKSTVILVSAHKRKKHKHGHAVAKVTPVKDPTETLHPNHKAIGQ
jgi:hypothetical protein